MKEPQAVDPRIQPEEIFRNLYPTLTDQELKEAETNLRRYLEIAFEVHQEQVAPTAPFDTSPGIATMRERSKPSLKN